MPDQDTRLAVAENELGHMKVMFDENKEEHKEIRKQLTSLDTKIDRIDQHLAKQNGAIPHLQGDISLLVDKMRETTEEQRALKEQNIVSLMQAKDITLKTKILWAGAGSLLLTVIGVILKFVIGVI